MSATFVSDASNLFVVYHGRQIASVVVRPPDQQRVHYYD